MPTGLAVLEFPLCCGTNALRFPLEGEKMEPGFAAQSRDDLVHIMLAFGFYLEVRQEAISPEWFSVRQSYLVKLVWNAEHIVVELAGEDIHRDVAHVFPSSTVIPSAFDGLCSTHSQACQAPTELLMDVRVIEVLVIDRCHIVEPRLVVLHKFEGCRDFVRDAEFLFYGL